MYGIPHGFDSQKVFVGRILCAVTFAENVITLAFDNDLVVSALGSVRYQPPGDAEESVDTPPVSETRLVSLISLAVAATEIKSSRELVLRLEGGGSLTFVDDSATYESFIVQVGEHEIIV